MFFFSLALCFEIVFSLKPPDLINMVVRSVKQLAHTVFRTLSIKPMIVFNGSRARLWPLHLSNVSLMGPLIYNIHRGVWKPWLGSGL